MQFFLFIQSSHFWKLINSFIHTLLLYTWPMENELRVLIHMGIVTLIGHLPLKYPSCHISKTNHKFSYGQNG
jgi:hypothetical protein